MNDLISRQAAIEAIDRYYKDKRYITRSRTILSAICRDMKSTMDSLPSAQPEIIRCKDCKHRPTRDENGWLDFPTERCPCQNEDDDYYSWMPKDDWFCGNAERREE